MEITPSPFTLETFLPLVGQSFMAISPIDGNTVEFKLAEAEAIELHKRDGRLRGNVGSVRRDPFTLVFILDLLLPQQLYVLHNEVLGDVTIGLVPIGPFDTSYGYEAVFN